MTPDMNTEPLLIRYDYSEGVPIDLRLLGDSFKGLDSLLSDVGKLTNINGKVEVKASRIEHGSIEIYSAVHITYSALPFDNVVDLINFLRIADQELFKITHAYFSDLRNVDRDLNSFFRDRPFDATMLMYLVGNFIANFFKRSGKLKDNPTHVDAQLGDLAPKQASRFRAVILSGKYKRFLAPITQGNIDSIEVLGRDQKARATITSDNVGNYLPDSEQILPNLPNGSTHKLVGKLVAMQSTKGDSVKVKIDGFRRADALLVAYPDAGKSTENYKQFYGQKVVIIAEVVRRSLYHKPELVIKTMSVHQEEMGLDRT